ncbi:MAG: hypothetical protein UY77_C0019G0010 [Candidatus Uhrbacteria bacterium GW2011_GWA2_53_10]|uniref:SbsA Ig-like domain-containing protein n=1 Tax=Candidatus Uhrbacteria bacterium GW2011_GWA2_53_10 TaxID=1618980 RepID=A0A0G1XNQ6_9BACT|nr:MAG: hypothetical protein UY77_C0019G0010 [Candidatus Uhrbacteria bacterium GW2011_GWA2_53_10]
MDYDPAGRTAYLSPSALLAASKKHYIRLTTDIKDLAGNRLDGDTSTEGNQAEVIAFTTGTNINGGAADSTKPTILYANADNFSVAATLSEPVKFDPDEIETETTSGLAGMVNNISYWSVESPPGSQVNLSDKDIEYIPRDRTLIIRGLMLSPNQEVRVKAVTATGAAYIQDLSGNVINTASSGSIADVTVQSMQDSGGNLGPGAMTGGFDYFSMGTEPVMVYPRTGMAGVASNYEVEFNLNQSIPLGGTIVLTFPQGFSFVADGGSSECQDAVTSMENGDVNGPAQGTMTIDSVACSSAARTVTVTTAGAATGARDRLRFLIQGIVNSSVPKDYTTSGYSVDIKTKDIQGNMLESKTSMPFFLSQPGTQHIHGYVFNDNGAVGGTANNKTKDGGEPGVASVQVCLGGMGGFTCQNTTATGAFFFNSLSNGFYHIDVPPLSAGSFVGGPFYKDMELIGGNSFDNIGFALRSSDVNINVTINGIPTGTNIDVFAFNPTNFDAGGNIVRAVLWNGSASRTVALPVSDGTWEVGVGPWMQKDRGLGPQQMPTFTFLPPKSQQVLVSGGDGAVTFNLQSANRTVSGTVLDGAGVAIPNAFIMARPAKFTSGIGGGGGAQSQFNGRFSLNLADGVYLIEATISGMPMSNSAEVTVTADTSNYSVDHNSTADVYANGVLVINDGDSDSDDIVLKIAKGGRSIAGLVLDESGNAISYAHVMAEQVDSSGNPIGRFSDSPTDSSGNFTIYVSDGIWKLRGFAPLRAISR